MHNLTKIKLFRLALWITYPISIVLVYPFVWLRRKNKSHLFFFFDRYSIGGAQRVHLDILESVRDTPKLVFFTRRSHDIKLKEQFYSLPNTSARDVHLWCDYLFLRLFSVHYFAFYLNRHANGTLLSANSTFFYDMLPFLSRKLYKIELLHNFSYGKKGMEFFGLLNYKYLHKRMVIDKFTKENIEKQYDAYQIPAPYKSKVEVVEFGVEVPEKLLKDYSPPLKVLYAGRGGIQKRVWLVNKIAESFLANNFSIQFHFAGPAIAEVSKSVKLTSVLHGEISEKKKMDEIYQDCHVVLLTSAYEGFPMVIKESMAFGCIPVVTALPGNLTHLAHLHNALLLHQINDENKLIAEAIGNLNTLLKDPLLTQQLSGNAYRYAKANFKKEIFITRYRELLGMPIEFMTNASFDTKSRSKP